MESLRFQLVMAVICLSLLVIMIAVQLMNGEFIIGMILYVAFYVMFCVVVRLNSELYDKKFMNRKCNNK